MRYTSGGKKKFIFWTLAVSGRKRQFLNIGPEQKVPVQILEGVVIEGLHKLGDLLGDLWLELFHKTKEKNGREFNVLRWTFCLGL